jgi:hypothetical protein
MRVCDLSEHVHAVLLDHVDLQQLLRLVDLHRATGISSNSHPAA